MPQVIPVDLPETPALAAETLARGELVVLPTDTVYGIAAPLAEAAIARIFAAKQRPPDRAVPVLLSDADAVARVAADFPAAARRLAEAFWPGPLTIALPKRAGLPPNLSQLPTVGVRVPDHDATRAVIAAAGGALAVTSANRSDHAPACTIHEAIAAFQDTVALYLDGRRCAGGVPSTVITFDEAGALHVLREGPLSAEVLRVALA